MGHQYWLHSRLQAEGTSSQHASHVHQGCYTGGLKSEAGSLMGGVMGHPKAIYPGMNFLGPLALKANYPRNTMSLLR